MDNRDEIIRTQMDVISTLVSNNLKNIADDIWGTPAPKTPNINKTPAPKTPEAGPAVTPTPEQAVSGEQAAEEETPPE